MSTWIEEFFILNPDVKEDDISVTKKEHKLDLFKVVLPAIDRRNKDFYNSVSDDEQKELGKLIWPLTRWMSSSKNNTEHHILIVNDLVNVNSSALKSHPELQWKLLALCGYGKPQMHQWISPPKGIKKNKLEEAIIKVHPLLKDDELELFIALNNKDDFIAFFKESGLTDKEINELLT